MNNLALQMQTVNAPNAEDWRVITEQSQMLIKTGFLPQSIKTPEQAVAIILQGRELGIPTMAALGTINVIQGKPTVSPQLMLALINRSGQLEDIKIQGDSGGVSCTMKRRGRTAHTEFFGKTQAADMQLGGKDNYKKQAATMYRWRAVAACARTVFPDVILGLYTPDEMGAENVNESGELIPETATIHQMPTKKELVEAVREEASLNKQLADLCAGLNQSGDSIQWTQGTLTEYAREFFEIEVLNSYQFLTDAFKNILIGDLRARLEENLAIQIENVIEGETVEDVEQAVF